jgi:F-type H+-transporting ATPase subunit b
MNIFLMPTTQMLAMTEGAGGLFDFNATLPLMAIQFILLTVVLTFIFYKPVSKVIDEREIYISGNLTQASEKLIKADELYKEYDEQLKAARVNAQSIIAQSEKEAKDVVALEITEARADAAKLIEQTNKELEAQKSLALQKLETQVDELSQLIKEKLLGKEVVLWLSF